MPNTVVVVLVRFVDDATKRPVNADTEDARQTNWAHRTRTLDNNIRATAPLDVLVVVLVLDLAE